MAEKSYSSYEMVEMLLQVFYLNTTMPMMILNMQHLYVYDYVYLNKNKLFYHVILDHLIFYLIYYKIYIIDLNLMDQNLKKNSNIIIHYLLKKNDVLIVLQVDLMIRQHNINDPIIILYGYIGEICIKTYR